MPGHAAGRLSLIAACAILLGLVSGCNSNPTAPTPTVQTTNFTGTLEPEGVDFKPFQITYAQGPTELSVTVHSLTTIAGGTPVTGVTIGVGFGTVSGPTCAMQIFAPAATLGQELFTPNGAGAGSYCVQIFDCPSGMEGCESVLTEPVTYSLSIRHF